MNTWPPTIWDQFVMDHNLLPSAQLRFAEWLKSESIDPDTLSAWYLHLMFGRWQALYREEQ